MRKHFQKFHPDIYYNKPALLSYLHQTGCTADKCFRFFPKQTVIYLFKNKIFRTFEEYIKNFTVTSNKINRFYDTLSQYREIKETDISILYEYVIPYKEKNGKCIGQSKELAIAFCAGDKEEGEKFYKKIFMAKNPFTGHDGTLSPYSKDFNGYKGLSEEEKQKIINSRNGSKENPNWKAENSPVRIEYYLKQGLSEKEAKQALAIRQRTFSKKICIEKYGKEEGLKIWKDRNENWYKTKVISKLVEIIKKRETKMEKLAHQRNCEINV